MGTALTYPGLYVQEVSSGVHTIVGASTSNTAFADVFARGPIDTPVRITCWDDFERTFGGLFRDSEASYAIQQYYLNQGQIAWVIRVGTGAPVASRMLVPWTAAGWDELLISAANPGKWGDDLVAAVQYPDGSMTSFNLYVQLTRVVNTRTIILASETFLNLNMTPGDPQYALAVVNQSSQLVSLSDATLSVPSGTFSTAAMPAVTAPIIPPFLNLSGGADANVITASTGALVNAADFAKSLIAASPYDLATLGHKAGITALDEIAPEIFNILCLPVAARLGGSMSAVYVAAIAYCEAMRACCIVDIPDTVKRNSDMTAWMTANASLRSPNSAVYFPRLTIPDALNNNRPRDVAASGTLAGVWARTDATRHVWKAPAGTEATLTNAEVVTTLTDLENGELNPLGINVLRSFPLYGSVSWGARTLVGADQMASEWKYIPVRRIALYIEETMVESLKWVVFEPNDAPLWAQIRLNVGAFMQDLFRNGAFQGSSPSDAYFVKCDKNTTTQQDIDRGIVNILIGFAPLKPAEFVVIKLQQIAGQLTP